MSHNVSTYTGVLREEQRGRAVGKKNPPLQQSMSPSSIKTQYETKGGFFLVRVACSYRMCYEDRLSPQGILTLSQARILVKPVVFFVLV